MRWCWFCLRGLTDEEIGQCEFVPTHPSHNPRLAEQGVNCPGSGGHFLDHDPRVLWREADERRRRERLAQLDGQPRLDQ